MPDSRPLRGAGEAPVGDEGDRGPQLGIGGDRLGGVEHLGHARALGALVADEHGVARLDLMMEHRGERILLAVEGAGAEHRLEHLAGHHGVLDNGPIGREVAAQDGDGSVGSKRVVDRADHIGALEAPRVQMTLAGLVVPARAQVVEVLAEGLTGHRHRVQVKVVADLLHDGGDTARVVEELGRPLTRGADVQQVAGTTMHAVEVICRDLDAKFPGDGGDVQKRVGGTRDGGMHHDEVLEALPRDDVTGLEAATRQANRLTACLERSLAQFGARSGQERRAGQCEAERLRGDLHRGCRAHERAGAAARAGVALVVVELLTADLAALVLGGVHTELLQGEQVGAGVHDAARHHDAGDVEAADGHEVRRHALVAAGHEHPGIEGGGVRMDLDHVGDGVAAGQGVVDPVVALRLAVADIGGEVPRPVAALLGDAGAHRFHELEEAGRSRVRVAEGGFDDDLGLRQILRLPARADAQRVELGGELTVFLTAQRRSKAASCGRRFR